MILTFHGIFISLLLLVKATYIACTVLGMLLNYKIIGILSIILDK